MKIDQKLTLFPYTSYMLSIFVFQNNVKCSRGILTGARCVQKKNKKKYYIILQGGELACFHFFKSSC